MRDEDFIFWLLRPFDRATGIVIVTGIVAVLLPLSFHVFMYWTTRRRKFVGREFYDEVNIWLADMQRKYTADASKSTKSRKLSSKKFPVKKPTNNDPSE
jgi:hypothetical protein